MESLFIDKYIREFYGLFSEKIDGYGTGFIGNKLFLRLLMQSKLGIFIDNDLIGETLDVFRYYGLIDRKERYSHMFKSIQIDGVDIEQQELIFYKKDRYADSSFENRVTDIVKYILNFDGYFHKFLNYEEIVKLLNLEARKVLQAQNILGVEVYEKYKDQFDLPKYELGVDIYKQKVVIGNFTSEMVTLMKHNLSRKDYEKILKKFKSNYLSTKIMEIKELISQIE